MCLILIRGLNLQCAETVGLSEKTKTSILQCIEGPKANELLVSHGKTTKNLNPNLSFVPTITINGVSILDTSITYFQRGRTITI